MKRYLLYMFGIIAITACLMQEAKPMRAAFNGTTGNMIQSMIVNPRHVDFIQALTICHVDDLKHVGAKLIVPISSATGQNGWVLIVDIYW